MTRRAFAAAVALLLAFPTVALGASSTADETLTVESTLTLTGVPAAISYGSGFAGDQLSQSISITSGSNNDTGHTLTTDGSDLINGDHTIPSTARTLWYDEQGPCGATCDVLVEYDEPGTEQVVWTMTGPGERSRNFIPGLLIDLPADAVGGTYSGTVSFTVTANP